MKPVTLRDARMIFRLMCGSHSWSYPLLQYAPEKHRFAPNRTKMVGRATALCVEGFPHSGNTFFVRLIQHWNKDLILARHMHVLQQVAKAIGTGIPLLC